MELRKIRFSLINRQRQSPSKALTQFHLFYGFIIVLVSFLVLFSAYGVRFAYGVFFNPMAEQLGFNAATTSAAYSISFFIEGVFSLISGGLADRFGPLLTGYLFDLTGSYYIALLICCGSSIAALIFTLMIRPGPDS